MKLNKRLLLVLIIASLVPACYLRIVEWRTGHFESAYALFESLLFNSLISVIVTLTISWAILSILHVLNQKMPWNSNLPKRLLAEIGITFPVALALGYLLGNLAYLIHFTNDQPYSDFIFSFLAISGFMNLILVAISDWFYFFERWKESLIEKEKAVTNNALLQKENIQARYEVLKNQINPHFLFNSLNVLSSLVHTDPDQAEEFIDEFASLYRYILEQHEKDLVSLAEEIEVSKSYYFLQKIRFNSGLDCQFRIKKSEMISYYLFPLSVQTLLENAIKHNSASIESPLLIELFIENNYLVISNTLQARKPTKPSTGIGLQNLRLKYSYYGMVPIFEQSEKHYKCFLPLIQKTDLPVIN